MEDSTKLRSAPKGKEKRQNYNQNEVQPKRTTKIQSAAKSDLSQLVPPQPPCGSSPVKKCLSEANKIIKIGIEREFALQEKDATLQKLSETIDNLRKNIIHLQMEYEKLDQNYQREISCRSEIVKRMDATRNIVESAVQYSNKLSASVKQLEDDKLKIAEFYELIYQGQKEVEEKHLKLEKSIENKELSLKSKISEIKKSQEETQSQNAEVIAQLNRKLSYTTEKLEITSNDREKLQEKIKELKETLSSLETALLEHEKLNNSQNETIKNFELFKKKWKFERRKYEKLLKNERKKFKRFKINYKNFKRNVIELEKLHKKGLLENEELKLKISKQTEALDRNKFTWESQKKELNQKVSANEIEISELKQANKDLENYISEFKKSEEDKRIILEHLQFDFDGVIEEKKTLIKNLKELGEEIRCKNKVVSELEAKLKAHVDGFESEIALYKNESEKYKKIVKTLEGKLSDAERTGDFERTQKDIIISDLNKKLEENLKSTIEKISISEKNLEEKIKIINQLCVEVKEKDSLIETLKAQLMNTSNENLKSLEILKDEQRSQIIKYENLNAAHHVLTKNNEKLKNELDVKRQQILDLEAKLNEEKFSYKSCISAKCELERKANELEKEIEKEKKASEVLRQHNKKVESELGKLQKVEEENFGLKTTIADLKTLLEGTEAKVEAYKVVVKKLEAEKAEAKITQNEELSKLKSEIALLENLEKKNEEKIQDDIFQKNFKDQPIKRDMETRGRKAKEKSTESATQRLNSKENDPAIAEIITINRSPTTSLQQSKKILSTPRKILSSTPQSSFRNFTPITKRRDPYEFDSDSSVERFDPEQVLKVFSNRTKKEPNKKAKTNKYNN